MRQVLISLVEEFVPNTRSSATSRIILRKFRRIFVEKRYWISQLRFSSHKFALLVQINGFSFCGILVQNDENDRVTVAFVKKWFIRKFFKVMTVSPQYWKKWSKFPKMICAEIGVWNLRFSSNHLWPKERSKDWLRNATCSQPSKKQRVCLNDRCQPNICSAELHEGGNLKNCSQILPEKPKFFYLWTTWSMLLKL